MNRSSFTRLNQWIGTALLICLTTLPTDAQAQQSRPGGNTGGRPSFQGGRGVPGGGFNRGSGLFGTLFREEAQQELGLSEEQVDQAREISGKARMSREEMQPFSDKIRAAGDDEAQVAAIQAQIAATNEQKAAAAELELKNLIGEEKVTRLRQLNLQFDGARALTGNEQLQTQLKLSEQQTQQLEAMNEQRSEARRSLGFRASEEDRQRFDREWNGKMFGVLNDEQRQQWSEHAGEIIVSNGVPGAAAPTPSSAPSTPGPGTAASAVVEAEEDTTPPNINDPLIRPDDPREGERISSFAPIPSSNQPPRVVAQVDTANAPLEAPESTESAEEPLKPLPQKDTVGFGSLPNAKAQKVSFNFAYAPWKEVLKMFAELSGLTLDLTTTPVGTFNYYDDTEYTPVEALDVLNGYLIQKGYLLVRRNQFLVVLNIDQGIPPNVIPDVPLSELNNRGRYELMRIRIPLGGLDPNIAAREVDPLLGPQGKVVPLTTSKSLLITDIGDNLRVIAQLLESVTTDEDPSEIIFQQFVIKTMSASEAESIVEAQFGLTPTAANVSAFTGNDRGRSSSSSSSSNSSNISITSDRRTNSLLVTAPRGQMKLIESLLASVDVGEKPYDPKTDPNINNEPYLRAHSVLNADAREVAKTLSSMLPEGVVINEEGRNRRVHIFGNDEMQEKAAKMIKDLDTANSDVAVEVFFLNKYDPVSAALMLDAMFINEGEQAPVIEPDSFGRRLMIRATHDQLAQIKALMGPLGETGVVTGTGRGNVRVINAGNRNAAEMLQMLQEVWVQQAPNPIRVSIPSQRSPIRGEFVPSKLDEAEESEPETAPSAQRPKPGSFQEQLLKDLEQLLTTQTGTNSVDDVLQAIDDEVQDAIEGRQPILDLTPAGERSKTETPAAGADAAGTDLEEELLRRLGNDSTAPVDGSAPEMLITLRGDNIVIASDDEAALDQLEDLLQSIGMAFPPQKDWTIFYLQSTDATEVAYMIEKLIPDSAVSTTTSSSDGSLMGELTAGLMGLGQSVADSSGLSSFTESSTSLRIIPETRLNALFVTGPNHLIAEVEEFLRFLDASELPPSLRDRLPRTIPVEYADVNEVYNIVSDIYKDYMTSGNPAAGGNNRNNPLAALMGQGGGNNRNGSNARPQLAKLTLGVDERTSQLIVSASDALYREIEAMVLKIDQDAKEAKPQVQVIRLETADALMIQQTLQQMYPRVKVTSTPTTRNNNQGNQNDNRGDDNNRDSNRDSNRNNNDQQQQQQEMLRRIQEMRNQQGGGGQQGGNRGGGIFGGGNRGGGGSRGGSGRGGR